MSTTRIIIISLFAFSLLGVCDAQEVHHADTFTLDTVLNPSRSHEYTASRYIDLTPGFSSAPAHGKRTMLGTDPFGVFPPKEGITGGPNPGDEGVVGAIGGVVDVGALGAAIYSIPLELPDGINGMKPRLAVTYNSQSGNGLMGWGWDVTGLSAVERTGRTRFHDGVCGAVTLNDTTDRFSIDGTRLIAVAGYGDSTEYKKELDDMSRIMAYFASLPSDSPRDTESTRTIQRFKVWSSDGTVLEYGGTGDSRLTLRDSGPRAFRWLLSRASDRHGNSVLYHYDTHPDTGECYIASIDYTEHSENGSVTVSPEFTVSFCYRPGYSGDWDFRYVAGRPVIIRKLLDHISVSRNGSGAELARYSFVYRECIPERYYDTVRMRNRLDSVFYEAGGARLNPTRIAWSKNTDHAVVERVLMTQQDTAIYTNYPFAGDFNGDGFTDLAVVPLKDSAYASRPDIRFFLNDPLDPGNFTQDPAMTVTGMERTLDWLYPVDLNDDGFDDLVAFFLDSTAATGRDTVSVLILENAGGSHFTRLDSVGMGGCRLLVHTGDFLGTGTVQLLLAPVKALPGQQVLFHPMLVIRDTGGVVMKPSDLSVHLTRDVKTGDFNGDGRDEVMVVTSSLSRFYTLLDDGASVVFDTLFSTAEINHADGRWSHVFPGDFNGDGITDILHGRPSTAGSTCWKIHYATGNSFLSSEHIARLGNYEMPDFNLYPNSLRLVSEALIQPYPGRYWSYGVCVADFDGDGSDDIAVSNMNPTYSSISVFCGHNLFTGKFRALFSGSAYNGAHPGCIINCRSQYFHPGRYLGGENVSFLGLEHRNTSHTHNCPGVFSLKPESALNSVKDITDGLGNVTSLDFGYVLQPHASLGHGVKRPAVPLRVLTAATVRNVSGKPVRTVYGYQDACHHRDGHGWLGFRRTEKSRYADDAECSRTVSRLSLETMGDLASLLPETDSVWAFPDGTAALSSVTGYSFEKARSNYGTLNTGHLVARPALTGKTVTVYDPDNPGAALSKTFTENRYNYNNGFYWHTYRCDSTMTGVGDASATGFDGCEFRTVESTGFYQNDYPSWTLNKPHVRTLAQSRTGKPDVVRSRWYLYTSPASFQVCRTFEQPGRVLDQSPFLLRTDFEYHPEGNLMRKTVAVPYREHGEQQKSVEYGYGPGGQRRLVTSETVSSGDLSYTTSYSYDTYDLTDTVTAPSGLSEAFESDPLGIGTLTVGADGARTHTVKRWAAGHPLAPAGASYYIWTGSSDGSGTMVFHHRTGAVLRSVATSLRGEPVITDRHYDNRGRLTALSEPYKEGEVIQWTRYTHDGMDRPVTVTAPDGTETSLVYDGFLTETSVTPPSGSTRRSTETVNAMGWTVHRSDAEGGDVSYDHFPDGLLAGATVNNHPATAVTVTYDPARNRSSLTDPDYGTLTTVHDAYGRLVASASPRELDAQRETSFTYDGLDRPVRVDDGMESTVTEYTYNEAGKKKGTLAGTLLKRQGGDDIQRIGYTRDSLARIVAETEVRTEGSYTTLFEYDSVSRLSRVVHPTGVAARYRYAHGRIKAVTDDGGATLWRTDSLNAWGQPLTVRQGSELATRYTYDPEHRAVKEIKTGKGNTFLQNLSYTYDNFGNLASRKDNTTGMEETFFYDNLDRLTDVRTGTTLTGHTAYDIYGRMTAKTADGRDVFNAGDSGYNMVDKPHALKKAAVSAGLFPSPAQTVSYTGFDKTLKVRQGVDSLVYTYGHDRQRIAMEERVGARHRTKRYVGGCEFVTETEGGNTLTRSLTFLAGPFGVFAVVEKHGGEETLHYVLKDNLGSWTAVTDTGGNVEQRLSYDAWGSLRDPTTWSGCFTGTPLFDRGFTGHEHLTAFGLINMNGRMYDPVMSSFLSVDRFLQDPTSAQGFNRYAYCGHNPLRYVDPSGWEMVKPVPGRTPSSADYVMDPYAYAERAYEPRDFRNPYYQCNLALYGNMGGPNGSGTGLGGGYYGSYGYYVTQYANSVYNYDFLSSMLVLMQNWQNSPCYSTNKALKNAGLFNMTAGELYGEFNGIPGYRNTHFTWTDANGNAHTADVLYEYVGGNANGVLTVSNQPLWMYDAKSPMETANILAQSLGVPMGTISEGVEMAAKSYHNVPLLKTGSGLTQAQKIAALSKEGLALSRAAKGLGIVGAGVSSVISMHNMTSFYSNGGTGNEVWVKTFFDIGMSALGIIGGPIGLGISMGYFVLDLSTDGFGVSYDIKP